MTATRTTNRANPSGSSTLSTSSLIDALSNYSDVELITASSEPEISDYAKENVNDATSPRTDSEQGNEGEMNSTSVVLEGLKGELSSYLAKVSDIDILRWLQQNESALPCWVAAARKVLLVQPSSVAFNQQQQSSLQDYIETSLMLQYNISAEYTQLLL